MRSRSMVCHLLLLLMIGASAGAAPAPKGAALSPRELLALAPQAVSELDGAARERARMRLLAALVAQSGAGLRPMLLPAEPRLPPAVELPLSPALQKVLALDLQRRTHDQDPILVGALLATALKPMAAPGLLEPPGAPGEASAQLILPAGLTPFAAKSLRSLCERAAADWPTLLIRSTVRLTAGMPFLVMLSQAEQVVYVNPVLLTLVAAPVGEPDTAAALPINPERELTYRSLADCARKVQAGCQGCLGGDAAQCAAMRSVLGSLDCSLAVADLSKLGDLCAARALALGSVADCVSAEEPSCMAMPPAAGCRERIDTCIATPDAGATHPSTRLGGGVALPACSDCSGPCVGAPRECGGASCERDCQTCNSQCNQCSRDCQSCNRQCNQCNGDCTRQCNQCNGDCSRCGSQCSQCNSDCNRCNNDCNSCGNDCNQCNSDCNSCGNECNSCGNDCNNCGNCNNQCNLAGSSRVYPRFPTPPGPAPPPPPLASMLVGARGAVTLVLPPLLFLWWRRRLYRAREQRGAR